MSGSARTDADNVSSSLKLKRRSAPRRYLMRDSLAKIARAFRGAATARFKAGTLDKENRQFLAKLAGMGDCFSEWPTKRLAPWAARDQDSGVTDTTRKWRPKPMRSLKMDSGIPGLPLV